MRAPCVFLGQSVPRPASRAGAHMPFASARPAEQLPSSHRRAPEAEGTQAFVVTNPWLYVLSHLGRSPWHSAAAARRPKATCHKHLGQEGPNNVEAQRVANHCPKLAISDVSLATGVRVDRQRLEAQPFWDRQPAFTRW